MGPNVKFVSAITDAFSNKKNGGQFFPQKRPNRGVGGGGRGGFCKRPYFCRIFFLHPSLRKVEKLESRRVGKWKSRKVEK